MAALAARLSNRTSSNIKTNMINTDQFTHIFDSIDVSSPIICFQKSTNIYHIDCEKLDISIESYFSTAHITYYGIWKNNTSFPIDSIFIMPYYSTINLIECTINSQNVIRTTSILKHKHIKKTRKISEETKTSHLDAQNDIHNLNINKSTKIALNDINNHSIYTDKNRNSWCAEEMGLFSHQIDAQFRVPIFDLLPNQQVIVKIKFIQSLHNDGIHGYRLRLPLQFYHPKYPKYDESTSNNDNNDDPTTIKTRNELKLAHSNSSIMMNVNSNGSNLAQTKSKNRKWSEYVTLKCNIYYPQKLGFT